jgi:hypothetical protein
VAHHLTLKETGQQQVVVFLTLKEAKRLQMVIILTLKDIVQ